ncbi:MAG TPA: hypothetical protein VKG45_11805 [Actinomycetes bacterium]|nr:hypothetical protein [Actinomycetes bacterium]
MESDRVSLDRGAAGFGRAAAVLAGAVRLLVAALLLGTVLLILALVDQSVAGAAVAARGSSAGAQVEATRTPAGGPRTPGAAGSSGAPQAVVERYARAWEAAARQLPRGADAPPGPVEVAALQAGTQPDGRGRDASGVPPPLQLAWPGARAHEARQRLSNPPRIPDPTAGDVGEEGTVAPETSRWITFSSSPFPPEGKAKRPASGLPGPWEQHTVLLRTGESVSFTARSSSKGGVEFAPGTGPRGEPFRWPDGTEEYQWFQTRDGFVPLRTRVLDNEVEVAEVTLPPPTVLYENGLADFGNLLQVTITTDPHPQPPPPDWKVESVKVNLDAATVLPITTRVSRADGVTFGEGPGPVGTPEVLPDGTQLYRWYRLYGPDGEHMDMRLDTKVTPYNDREVSFRSAYSDDTWVERESGYEIRIAVPTEPELRVKPQPSPLWGGHLVEGVADYGGMTAKFLIQVTRDGRAFRGSGPVGAYTEDAVDHSRTYSWFSIEKEDGSTLVIPMQVHTEADGTIRSFGRFDGLVPAQRAFNPQGPPPRELREQRSELESPTDPADLGTPAGATTSARAQEPGGEAPRQALQADLGPPDQTPPATPATPMAGAVRPAETAEAAAASPAPPVVSGQPSGPVAGWPPTPPSDQPTHVAEAPQTAPAAPELAAPGELVEADGSAPEDGAGGAVGPVQMADVEGDAGPGLPFGGASLPS